MITAPTGKHLRSNRNYDTYTIGLGATVRKVEESIIGGGRDGAATAARHKLEEERMIQRRICGENPHKTNIYYVVAKSYVFRSWIR